MFFGVISDCFPIMGYRRRPYMVIGWVFCVVILFIMAAMSVPDPYYGDASMHNIGEEEWTPEQIASINENASSSAGKYVVPMMLASFGYLLCEVAADAMVVEYAQREPIEQRGRVQTAVYAVKTSFTALGAAVIAFFMNGEEYAGTFDFSLTFQQLMLISGIICTPLVFVSWFFLHEDRVTHKPTFGQYMSTFWGMLQKRAIYQIVAYKFFSGVFNSFNIVSSSNIKLYWVHATPFNNSLMTIVGTIFYATTLALTGKYGLDWNWRTIIIVTMCGALSIDAVVRAGLAASSDGPALGCRVHTQHVHDSEPHECSHENHHHPHALALAHASLAAEGLRGIPLVRKQWQEYERHQLHAVAEQDCVRHVAARLVRVGHDVVLPDVKARVDDLGSGAPERSGHVVGGCQQPVQRALSALLDKLHHNVVAHDEADGVRDFSDHWHAEPEPLAADDVPRDEHCHHAVRDNSKDDSGGNGDVPVPVQSTLCHHS
ncbi:hypothetical protein PF004_g9305 [Phytophthora fragariae]|uniref:Uncharacterized protein n=1 Tax=Phytophthora fragariae TaxID=53985 RepID=A0A6G0P491_9STRA|nr:hypothetical protein PF004_g9305 [Phytophthora fragariae]